MMISVILIVLLILFCLKYNSKVVLCLLLFLMPLHELLKHSVVFFTGSSGILPLWREVIIFILFVKVFFVERHYKVDKILSFLSVFIIVLSFVFLLVGGCRSSGIVLFRIYVSVFMLMISMSSISLSLMDMKRLLKCILLSVFVVCVLGVLQQFFFSMPFGLFLGTIEFSSNGGLQYVSSSYTVLGVTDGAIPRMYGVVGGPNAFGVYLSVCLSYLFFVISEKRFLVQSLLVKIAFAFSLFCILMSISRAGWIVFSFVFLFYQYRKGNLSICIKYMVTVVLSLCVLVGVIYFVSPDSVSVYIATFTGEESSVASRSSMIEDSFSIFFENMLGEGLGFSHGHLMTMAESSLLLFAMDTGVIGFFSISVLFLYVLKSIYFRSRNNMIYSFFFAHVLISYVVAFVSVNMFEWPYVYYLFIIMGFGFNPSFIVVRNVIKFKQKLLLNAKSGFRGYSMYE